MNKVMLVDDDKMMLDLLQTLLEIEGFEVIPVRSGEIRDLPGRVHSTKPDTILLDVHLASHNGIDLLRELRADHRSSGVSILMTSGEDLRESCLAAGADGFLLKPYMPDELIQRLRANGH